MFQKESLCYNGAKIQRVSTGIKNLHFYLNYLTWSFLQYEYPAEPAAGTIFQTKNLHQETKSCLGLFCTGVGPTSDKNGFSQT